MTTLQTERPALGEKLDSLGSLAGPVAIAEQLATDFNKSKLSGKANNFSSEQLQRLKLTLEFLLEFQGSDAAIPKLNQIDLSKIRIGINAIKAFECAKNIQDEVNESGIFTADFQDRIVANKPFVDAQLAAALLLISKMKTFSE